MRVLFLGRGSFAIPSLEALLAAGHDVAAVVTQPDREKGRGRELSPPPLKPVAAARGLKVLQPRRVREPESVAALEALVPEVQVVVPYGPVAPRRPGRRIARAHAEGTGRRCHRSAAAGSRPGEPRPPHKEGRRPHGLAAPGPRPGPQGPRLPRLAGGAHPAARPGSAGPARAGRGGERDSGHPAPGGSRRARRRLWRR